MTLSDSQQQLMAQFSAMRGWEDKYRHILRLGKSLPVMDESLKVDDALLSGCESKVWFYGQVNNQQLSLNIYSDAKIVRGLVAIITESFSSMNCADVQEFDCLSFLEELGLMSHLSPSRGNGIRAIVNEIKSLV